MVFSRRKKLAGILFAILAVSFVAILAALPFHAFISTWGGTEIGPLMAWKAWKEILLVLLVPIVLWYCWLRPEVMRELWGRALNKVVLAYGLLSVLLAITSQAISQAVVAGLLMNLRFFAMFLLAQLLVAHGHPLTERIKAAVPSGLLLVTMLVSIFAILQVFILPPDFLSLFGYDKNTTIAPYILVDQNPEALRAFATLRGPNDLGAYLLLPLALAAVLFARRRSRLALAAGILGGVALILTGSRSAWLAAIVAAASLAIILLPGEKLLKWVKIGAIPLILVIVAFLWVATTFAPLRLAVFHSSPTDSSLFEGSTEKHWQATAAGIQNMLAHPLGSGVGTAGPASFYGAPNISENYFVQIGQEVGLVGLALFAAICVAVAIRLWHRRREHLAMALLASFAGLAVINLFLHGWSDDPTAMTWWGIAGLSVYNGITVNKKVRK